MTKSIVRNAWISLTGSAPSAMMSANFPTVGVALRGQRIAGRARQFQTQMHMHVHESRHEPSTKAITTGAGSAAAEMPIALHAAATAAPIRKDLSDFMAGALTPFGLHYVAKFSF
jgi:hypothetical protein